MSRCPPFSHEITEWVSIFSQKRRMLSLVEKERTKDECTNRACCKWCQWGQREFRNRNFLGFLFCTPGEGVSENPKLLLRLSFDSPTKPSRGSCNSPTPHLLLYRTFLIFSVPLSMLAFIVTRMSASAFFSRLVGSKRKEEWWTVGIILRMQSSSPHCWEGSQLPIESFRYTRNWLCSRSSEVRCIESQLWMFSSVYKLCFVEWQKN